MNRLEKVDGVRNLYRDPISLLYYVRSQKGGFNSFTSLNTTRKEQAIKNAEDLKSVQFRNRHNIPDEKRTKHSPAICGLLDEYRETGYPNARQKARDEDSSYFRDQEAYYTNLKLFFAQKLVSELRPALLNEYPTTRSISLSRSETKALNWSFRWGPPVSFITSPSP